MSGLFGKMRVVLVGHANDLVNRVIDMDSPSALRQYARDLQVAIQEAGDNAATAAGTITTHKREIEVMTRQIEDGKIIAAKLNASSDPLDKTRALSKAKLVLEWTNQIAIKKQTLTDEMSNSMQLDNVVEQLKGKASMANARVQQLESMDADTKAKSHMNEALKHVNDLLSTGQDIDIDNISARVTAAHDIADAHFQRTMTSMDDGGAGNSDAQALLDSLAEPKTLTAGA